MFSCERRGNEFVIFDLPESLPCTQRLAHCTTKMGGGLARSVIERSRHHFVREKRIRRALGISADDSADIDITGVEDMRTGS